MTPLQMELQQSYDIGYNALMSFHNYSAYNYRSVYKISSVDQLITILTSRANQKNFVRILGGAIEGSDLTPNQVDRAMEKMTEKSYGRIPADNAAFISAIQGKAGEFSYVDAIGYAAIESAKDAANAAAYVGDKVIGAGKDALDAASWSINLAKYAIPIAVVFLIYAYSKGTANRLGA